MEEDDFVFIENDMSQSAWVDVKKPQQQQQLQQQQLHKQLPLPLPSLSVPAEPQLLSVYPVFEDNISSNIDNNDTFVQESKPLVDQQSTQPQEQTVPIIETIVKEEPSQVPSPTAINKQQEEPEWLKGKEKTTYITTISSGIKYVSSNIADKPYITTMKSSERYTSYSSSKPYVSIKNSDSPYTTTITESSKSYVSASKSTNGYSYAF